MTTLVAAHRKICLPFFSFCLRVSLRALLFAIACLWPFAAPAQIHAPAPPAAREPVAQEPGQNQTVIERIDFTGNRRIRNDTLRARILDRKSVV